MPIFSERTSKYLDRKAGEDTPLTQVLRDIRKTYDELLKAPTPFAKNAKRSKLSSLCSNLQHLVPQLHRYDLG